MASKSIKDVETLYTVISLWCSFKGTVSRDFRLIVFSWISFTQASEYTITSISNFFENSRRYSQLKVHHRCQRHRWQMEKIFKRKNFNNSAWAPLVSRVNIYINFFLQAHFKGSAAWYCPHYLPPVSLTPVANLPPVSLIPVAICHRRRWHPWQICRRHFDTGSLFATGVNDTSGTGCRTYRPAIHVGLRAFTTNQCKSWLYPTVRIYEFGYWWCDWY